MPLPDISNLAPLDDERLRELKEQTPQDSSLFNRLYALFEIEGATLIKDIVESLAVGDRSAVHEAVHKVKGSAAAMGASRIYALVSASIDICRADGDLGQLSGLPSILEIEYASYLKDAKRFLD